MHACVRACGKMHALWDVRLGEKMGPRDWTVRKAKQLLLWSPSKIIRMTHFMVSVQGVTPVVVNVPEGCGGVKVGETGAGKSVI